MKSNLFSRVSYLGAVCLAAYCLITVWLGTVTAADEHTIPQNQVRYVAADVGSDFDNDCTDSITPCATIQHVVDIAADYDTIYIATGVYTDMHSRQNVTQVVHIDKPLTLQGGCQVSDWSTCAAIPNATVIDAQSQGRGIFISDTETTLIGLTVINGSAAGLGGATGVAGVNQAAGGGLYTTNATVTVRHSFFFENTAVVGGGAFFYQSPESQIENSRFEQNTISGGGASGGAIYIRSSDDFVLQGSVVRNNRSLPGGGMQFHGGVFALTSKNLLVKQNLIDGNHANNACGGLCLNDSDNFMVSDNVIVNNTAGTMGFVNAAGGGFAFANSDGVMKRNIIQDNQSLTYGGGGSLSRSTVTFHNNVFVNNEIGANPALEGDGSALSVVGSAAQLLHTTFVSNTGGVGSGLYLVDVSGVNSTVALTNTIMDNQEIGVRVIGSSSATVDAVLWSDHITQTEGAVTVTQPYSGDPAFAADRYHLTADSAAIDKGIPTSVTTDIDGQAHLNMSDLGADEFYPAELELVSFQTLVDDPAELDNQFVARLASLQPQTTYIVTSYHAVDSDYPQETVTVTTDAAGLASLKIKSRCLDPDDNPLGSVFVRLAQDGVVLGDSNHIPCETIATLSEFGSYVVDAPENTDGIYRPSPPGPDTVRLWVRDAAGRSGLTGTIRIRSTSAAYDLPPQTVVDAGAGLYYYDWLIADEAMARDYRVQITLEDTAGNLSGVDQFIQLSGRAVWLWSDIQEILNNNNVVGDQYNLFAFATAPYKTADPSIKTIYFNVYPSISFTGTTMTETWHSFLQTAHLSHGLRIEALAGTYEWVESDEGMAEAKQLCDAILAVNQATAPAAEQFDGIHYDIEHDQWNAERWNRYLEIIIYCQQQIDAFNEAHDRSMLFGVDIPPHFLTSPNQTKSAWDVLMIVDTITLMDYRDFAAGPNGIIERAEPFIRLGNALGKPVVIGVELTPNPFEHVTFYEESYLEMEAELQQVSRYFVTDWSYQGLALHDYDAWINKLPQCLRWPICIYMPVVTR